ncbi:45352_t:CDS:2 [Gigaspora margarita]|uniref:45352_t:CDS:1 n=1 Tax=Gigaspora margarita TaxID=4874 RepID=A0ABN7ULX5_GIGMA|nr:45352_t:CDS:2 [Gigaspora margarita]
MSGRNIEGDYVESLNNNYSDVESVNSENSEHFLVRSETLRVFISLSLARYIISWYCANDIYSLILNNMVHLICAENVVFSDNSLVDLNFQTVVEAYGYNPSHEDFSLKTFLEQEIIFLDLSSGPDHSPDIPKEPGYHEWIVSSDLNLSSIEVEILNFFKGYLSDDSDDSMVIESNEISCEFFDGQSFYFSFYIKKDSLIPNDPDDQVQEVSDSEEDNPVLPIMGSPG